MKQKLSDYTYYPIICRVKGDKIVIHMPDLFGDREFYASNTKEAEYIMRQHAQMKVWDLKLEKKEIPSPSKYNDLQKDKDKWVMYVPVKI